MAEKEKVLEYLDEVCEKANDNQKAIIAFLRVWVAEDEGAAGKITAEKKNPGGAYSALAGYARKHSKECMDGTQKTVWVQIMKYYGEDETAADRKLEHGLMYAFLHSLAEQWRPYGKEAGGPSTGENPSSVSLRLPPSPQGEGKERSGKGFTMSLADLGL